MPSGRPRLTKPSEARPSVSAFRVPGSGFRVVTSATAQKRDTHGTANANAEPGTRNAEPQLAAQAANCYDARRTCQPHNTLSREVEGNGPVKPGNPPGASGARPETVPIPPMPARREMRNADSTAVYSSSLWVRSR